MTRIIFILFFYQSVFSQNEKDQIEMETTTLMNVPMMGTITTSVKSYASDKSFKKDNNIEIDKFYTRMMMGGNKRNGIILNGETKMRTVFDLEETIHDLLNSTKMYLKKQSTASSMHRESDRGATHPNVANTSYHIHQGPPVSSAFYFIHDVISV